MPAAPSAPSPRRGSAEPSVGFETELLKTAGGGPTDDSESRHGRRKNAAYRVLLADLVITGGGMAGVCRRYLRPRRHQSGVGAGPPVLGGNASSEVRLWILGATSHMGNNNRWAREGGVVDEILVENLYRNPEGNPLILDTILLEKVRAEKNITLLLNTAVSEVEKSGASTIAAVAGYCSQNQTRTE